ncbi:MAG: hypothetical protein HQ488_00955 [Parcubacteria group bacterium]|nr:hypothetical protein [Parcubacteria group bacterium]
MILSASDLFSKSWGLYRQNFWLFTGYAAWLILPLAAFLVLSTAPKHWIISVTIVIASLGELFVAIWILAAVILTTAQLLENKIVDSAQTSKNAMQSIRNLLATSFLQFLITVGGFILFIIPGLIFSIWYGLSQTIAVLTGKRPVDALAHSKSLVQGRFFPVAWRMISVPLVVGLSYSIMVGGIISFTASAMGLDPVELVKGELPIWAEILETTGEIIIIPFILIYSTLLYQNLNANPMSINPEKMDSLENTKDVA